MTVWVEWGQKIEHLRYAEEALAVTFDLADTKWLATVDEAGKLLGVVVYNHFTLYNCELSVAAADPRFLTREAIRAFFAYPFQQLGCRRVTSVVEVGNIRSYRFCRKFGFTVEGHLRKWFGEHDGTVLGLLKEECKWL